MNNNNASSIKSPHSFYQNHLTNTFDSFVFEEVEQVGRVEVLGASPKHNGLVGDVVEQLEHFVPEMCWYVIVFHRSLCILPSFLSPGLKRWDFKGICPGSRRLCQV